MAGKAKKTKRPDSGAYVDDAQLAGNFVVWVARVLKCKFVSID